MSSFLIPSFDSYRSSDGEDTVDGDTVDKVARVTEHYIRRNKSSIFNIQLTIVEFAREVLTGDTIVVTSEDIGNGDEDASVGQLEVVCEDDGGSATCGPEQDEPVVVGDLSGLAREVPIIIRNMWISYENRIEFKCGLHTR